MRLSTALTPRVICCAEDFPKHVALPRGCLNEVKELFKIHGVDIDVKDERFEGTKVDVSFHGQLTSLQQEASNILINHETGVFVAPPGIGKTTVGIYLISGRKRNTLVLVHRRQLLEQWRAQLASLLGIDLREIGIIGGGRDKQTGFIDVAMFQSLIQKNEVKDSSHTMVMLLWMNVITYPHLHLNRFYGKPERDLSLDSQQHPIVETATSL